MPMQIHSDDTLLTIARNNPASAHAAFAESGQCIGIDELAAKVTDAASRIKALNIRPEDRILIVLPDSIDLIIAFLAAEELQLSAVLGSPFCNRQELIAYLEDCMPSIIVLDASMEAVLQSIPAIRNISLVIVERATCSLRHPSWRLVRAIRDAIRPEISGSLAHCFILYTSGSTGSPKGVVHRYRSLYDVGHRVGSEVYGVDENDTILSFSKMTFAFGLGVSLAFALFCGATTLLLPTPFEPLQALADIRKHRVSLIAAVPFVYQRLISVVGESSSPDLESIRLALSAGEKLSPALHATFKTCFGVELLDGFGCTETLHHILAVRPTHVISGATGTPISDCDIRLQNEDGTLVAPGMPGLLYVKTPRNYCSYWNRGRLHSATDFHSTGDIFQQDSDGTFFYRGRKDGLIKVRDRRISLEELDQLLSQHPSVSEAAFIKHETRNQQQLVAFIVPKENRTVTLLELKQWLAGKIPAGAIVDRVFIVDKIPRTSNGKVHRPSLFAKPSSKTQHTIVFP